MPEGKAEVWEEGKGTEVGEEEVDDAEEGDGWRHDAEDEDHGEDQHVHRHMVGVVKLARLPDLLALFVQAQQM